MLKKLLLFAVALTISSSSSTYAAPAIDSVTGTTTLTITSTATNFGSKTTAAPALWDDFDSGTIGASIGSEGTWTKEAALPAVYDATGTRTGNGKQITMAVASSTSAHGMAYYNVTEWQISRKKLFSAWMKVNFTDMNSGQIKLIDMERGVSHATGPGIAEHSNWCWEDGCNNGGLTQQLESGGVGNLVYWYSGPTLQLIDTYTFDAYRDNTWVYVMFEYEESELNTANGNVNVYKSRESGVIEKELSSNKISQYSDGVVAEYAKLRAIIESGAESATVYYDDVYIDDSWARVEIGDDAVYADCTHREIQIPVTWEADGSEITATLNQGSFADAASVYVFVVDSSGVASTGEAFTIPQAHPLYKTEAGAIILQ